MYLDVDINEKFLVRREFFIDSKYLADKRTYGI